MESLYNDIQLSRSSRSFSSSLSKSTSFNRAPLSSISSNAQDILQAPSSWCDIRKSGYVKRLSSISLSSSTTPSSQNEGKHSSQSRQYRRASSRDIEWNHFKFDIEDVMGIFRKRDQPIEYAAVIQRANPIQHIEATLNAVSDTRQSQKKEQCVTLHIFQDDSVDMANLVSSCFKPSSIMNKEIQLPRYLDERNLLEPPNDEIFSDEMEDLLELKLSSPIYESDSESDVSEELSVSSQGPI